jgi:hypothetical protein
MDDHKDLESLGKHLVRVDGDSLYFVTRGVVILEELEQLVEIYRRIKREHRMLFVFLDGRHSDGLAPDVRRYSVADRDKVVADLQVAFGVPFALRVVLTMMDRANALLRRKNTPVHIFDTESEARSFFEKERVRLRRELAGRS